MDILIILLSLARENNAFQSISCKGSGSSDQNQHQKSQLSCIDPFI